MPRSGSGSSQPRLWAGLLIGAVLAGALLTGCSSQDAKPLAEQACAHVEKGLRAEHQASGASASKANRLELEALDQITDAVPFAAEAAGDDTSWQALEATLSESSRVPLRYLVPALSAQCAGVG